MFFRSRGEKRDNVAIDEEVLQSILHAAYGDNVSWSGITALRNSDIFTAVQTISSDIASSPIEIKIRGQTDKDSELNYLLNKRPNDYLTPWHFRFVIVANMLLNGSSYVQIIRDKQSNPVELHFLRNSIITIAEENGKIQYMVSSDIKGRTTTLQAADVLHFRMFTLDGFNSYSPLYALAKEVSIQEGSKKFLDSFFKKGASVGGILKLEKTRKSPEELKEYRKEFTEGYLGSKNAGGILVMDSLMDFKQLEVPTEILRFLNSYNFTTQQVAKAFGLPLSKMGIETVNTSVEQANLDYSQSTLSRLFYSLTSEMEFKLIPYPENHFTDINFNIDRLLEVDPKTKLGIVKGLKDANIINLNEARERYGYKPVEQGDRMLTDLNNTWLDMLEEYQLLRAKSKAKGGDGKHGEE